MHFSMASARVEDFGVTSRLNRVPSDGLVWQIRFRLNDHERISNNWNLPLALRLRPDDGEG
jgi:hypothetical protein